MLSSITVESHTHSAFLTKADTVVMDAAGGGGYGDPYERDPGLVARDVAEGWVSARRAEQVYGVALDADGQVDASATTRLRGARR